MEHEALFFFSKDRGKKIKSVDYAILLVSLRVKRKGFLLDYM